MAWCMSCLYSTASGPEVMCGFFHDPILFAHPAFAAARILWREGPVPGSSVLVARGETEEIGGRNGDAMS